MNGQEPGKAPTVFETSYVEEIPYIGKYLEDVIHAGYHPSDSEITRDRKSLLCLMAFFSFVVGVLNGAHDLWSGFPTRGIPTFLFSFLVMAGYLAFRRTRNLRFFRFSLLLLILIYPFAAQMIRGGIVLGGGAMVWALGSPVCAVMLYGPQRAQRWFLGFLILIVGTILAEPFCRQLPWVRGAAVQEWRFVAHLTGVSSIVYFLVRYFLNRLRREQSRSEALLLNILPAPIAERLKQGAQTIADGFSDVTIIFADLVGFTELAGARNPEETVVMLNRIFSAFDQLCEKHRLEKIKTIGDSYMVVGGLPHHRPDHAQAVASFALEMVQVVKDISRELGISLNIRIGINSGPVVAGVIGIRKFSFDLWGDSVNIASRMESSGVEGRIQVSEETFRRISPSFDCEKRGPVEVKGKGAMQTYFLRGKKPSAA